MKEQTKVSEYPGDLIADFGMSEYLIKVLAQEKKDKEKLRKFQDEGMSVVEAQKRCLLLAKERVDYADYEDSLEEPNPNRIMDKMAIEIFEDFLLQSK